MPKVSQSLSTKIKGYVREFGEVFTSQIDVKTNKQVLYCQCCNCEVNCDQRSHVTQHLVTKFHKSKVSGFKSKQISVQQLFAESQKDFNQDLCEFMVALNIPFTRLSKNMAKKFFDKYTKFKVPDPSTLWKCNLTPLYDQTIESIRNKLRDEYIWIQIDETAEPKKRKVVNVIIGSLNSDKTKCEKFVFDLNFVDNANSFTVVQCFNKTLNLLWPEGIKYEQVLVLVTDAAPYMKAAGKTLCETYPKLTHITCVAHAIHNVCEYLMVQYKDVNRLVTCGKKIFKKAPNRVNVFKEINPNIPLPPEPVKTRWGSWLEGVKYYAIYFNEFTEVVKKLDPEESAFIEEIQELIQKSELKNEITFIYSNYYCLSEAITRLETSGLTLNESLSTLESVYNRVEKTGGSGQRIFNKFKLVLNKNKGLTRIRAISAILNGESSQKLDIDLSPQQISSFIWCPITDCDIERSFSKLKFILSDRRLSFEEENLRKYLIIHCNSD